MKAILVGLALALGSTSASANSSTSTAGIPTLRQYGRSVHLVRLSLDQMARSASPSSAGIEGARQELQALDDVRLPSGAILPTGLPVLAADLAPGDRASLARVAREVDTIDQGLQVLPRRAADGAELGTLDTVLRDPRFHPQCAPLTCLGNWFSSLANRIESLIPGVARAPAIVPYAFAAAFLLLLILVVIFISRGVLSRIAVDVQSGVPKTETDEPRAALERATRYASTGDYRMALRNLFLATALSLQARGDIELRPGLTNRELLRTVISDTDASTPAFREPLRLLVDEFDRAWYGHLLFTAEDYARCEALTRAVMGATTGRRAA